jgi:trk system potassium uptake protein
VIAVGRAQRTLGRASVGVEIGAGVNLVGSILKYLGLAFLLPTVVALVYGEPPWPFLGAGAAAAAFGWALERATHGKERIGPREGFFVVSCTWVAAAFFVSLPYLLAREPQLANPLDAYFEAMSGMTTTGASVLTDVEGLDRSLAMWRQFSQWIGGMGIIVLALAVLPRLRVGGRQLFESEAPGPEAEQLATSMRETARRLWLLYIVLTIVMIAVLTAFAWTGLDRRMSFFDAAAHAFTTLPTGGFSTRARSVEEFGPATQWAIAFFMVVAGANFALMFRAFVRRSPRTLVRDEEFRLYLALLAVASVVLVTKLVTRGVYEGEEAVRHATFQVVSMMTTTGFASADFNEWPIFAGMVLVGLMFVGGSAASTAGALKVVRLLVLGRVLRRELDQTVHTEAVVPVRFNGAVVSERTARAVGSFVLLYAAVFVLGMLALVAFEAIGTARADLGWAEAISAAATTLGNVGPGLGFLGPMGSYESFTPASKAVMIVLMWMGRLELVPVAVLLMPRYWRA